MSGWSAEMADRTEELHGALIQHGRDGNRIYVMELPGFKGAYADASTASPSGATSPSAKQSGGGSRSGGGKGAFPFGCHSSGQGHLEDDEALCQALEELALSEGYTKIFAKVPTGRVLTFLRQGYRIEALVPRMFHGREDVFFLAWYPQLAWYPRGAGTETGTEKGSLLSKEGAARSIPDPDSMALLDKLIRSKCPIHEPPLSGKYRWFHCTGEDLEEMGALYKEVFDRYPFPIHKPEYLKETMQDHVEYFGIRRRDNHKLVGLSSAELHKGFNSVEMTDFAVLPETRGEGLALFLLRRMDEYAFQRRIPSAYTIARLRSPGMNATFIKGGYRYGGTLPGNTFIGGGLESMNVFYRVFS